MPQVVSDRTLNLVLKRGRAGNPKTPRGIGFEHASRQDTVGRVTHMPKVTNSEDSQ